MVFFLELVILKKLSSFNQIHFGSLSLRILFIRAQTIVDGHRTETKQITISWKPKQEASEITNCKWSVHLEATSLKSKQKSLIQIQEHLKDI